MKECVLCGTLTEAVANTRYCSACASEAAKERKKRWYISRKYDYRIPGQSPTLSEDIHKANILGLSYGVYIARFKPKEDSRNDVKRKRIF